MFGIQEAQDVEANIGEGGILEHPLILGGKEEFSGSSGCGHQ